MAKKYLDGINFDAPSKGFQGTLTIRDTEARGLIQDNANDIASLQAAQQVTARQVAQNMEDIDALEGRCTDIEDKNDEQDDRLTTAEHNIVSVTSRVTIAEQDIDNLETRMDAAEDDIDSLEDRMTTAESDIDALEGRMTTAEADIDALEGRMTTAESDIDALEGRMDTAEDDIEDIKAKDVEQDAHLADLDDRVAASTYEAGIGIYFGQGVEHTNINVEDELIDQINQNTQDIEELRETKTEIYTEENGERTNYPELTIDDTLEIVSDGGVNTLGVGKYIINYSVGSGNVLTAAATQANDQAAIKILKAINAGVRPVIYARVSKGVDTFTIPAVLDVGFGSGTKTSFDLMFILSDGYDTDVLKNDTYDYEDHISVSGSTVTHTIHMTDLRATRVSSNADGNGFLTYWRLPLVYKRYEYFNATRYLGPMDEGNDYYQSGPFVYATCTDITPHDGSTFTAALNDFTTIATKYPELAPTLYLRFGHQGQVEQETSGDAYWVPLTKIIYETTTPLSGSGEIKGFTGVFVDKSGNFWKVTYDIATSTGTINEVGGGLVVNNHILSL